MSKSFFSSGASFKSSVVSAKSSGGSSGMIFFSFCSGSFGGALKTARGSDAPDAVDGASGGGETVFNPAQEAEMAKTAITSIFFTAHSPKVYQCRRLPCLSRNSYLLQEGRAKKLRRLLHSTVFFALVNGLQTAQNPAPTEKKYRRLLFCRA